ncbi:protein EARLY FLOWERING 3-like [Durio zibethinus]|uniref:Protein EARLY FLOWERING 3-like n=1 Tax=Durio zibethinus TaxID=66656 RepID=A0A6P5ZBC2_DURZI|nr:protein EARLY FLOWERING 3-like [Durio zibethinus]XP_022750114.1 protein EARLY FLOWERING 3-like [Durio zibethinus]XP_022750115.1 protein EARLY FLOWERING 3-like [Durio zibethinus]
MKRGKDDEKIMGPMFPRLHVNDTEKGGPRAPPRNKMALYEQLSIPSQRFNPGVLPPNPTNSSRLVPPSSSSQGSSLEGNVLFPSRVSPSTTTNLAEKFHTRQLGGASVNAPLARAERRKKLRDDDDFMVPVFVNSKTGQQHNKTKNGFDGEKRPSLSPTYPGHQIKLQNVRDKGPNQSSSSGVNLRKEARDKSEESSKVCSSGESTVKTAADLSTGEKIDGCVKEANASPDQDFGEHPASRLSKSLENDACSLQELRAGQQPADNGCIDSVDFMRDIGEGILPRKRSMSYSEGNHSGPDETNNGSECRADKTCGSLQWANGDKSNEVSETSMVDSISGLDISPDDVVGIIGQKHFWKARRAIANQQRVFAVQVFELHRLIKVQRLIAGSPHLLLEDMAYLGKPSFTGSPAKKLPPEFIVTPLPHTKHNDDSEKPSNKMECSAENAVGRTSLSSVKNGNQPSNYGPFLGNPPPAPVNGDNKMNPWFFHHVPGHQWLVPVMSPSEGLIYKPYPGHGFMGSVCGGCGPFGQTPMTGNFMTSANGIPASTLGIGVLPGASPVGHSYFPPYGMPVMNQAVSGPAVEQMNQFAGPGSHAHSGQLAGGGADFNMQLQGSRNLPSEKNGSISHVMKFQASTETELQGSIASSPSERVQRIGASSAAEGKNALPLFTTAPIIPKDASQPCDTYQRTRVIRVVPHNPRSAPESAARIFQSIQKERKQI